MANKIRRQDVYGESLPTKKSQSVEPADFTIGGLIGLFDRKFKFAFPVRNIKEASDIFWPQSNPLIYGWDAINGFFNNVVGVTATLYVKSHVGYTGSAYDGVSATKTLADGSSASTIRLDSGYMTYTDYSAAGMRTGYTITNGARFSTTCATTGAASDTFVVLTSVAGVLVGDYMEFSGTGGGAFTVYKIITGIDQSTGKVSFAGVYDATHNIAAGDTCIVMGFRIRTWYKSPSGVVSEVDTDLGQIYCTMASTVSDFYFVNIFANSKFLVTTDLASASATGLNFPVDVASVTYLASGADGTAPTTNSHYAINNPFFDNLPIRFLANCETTNTTTQAALETYCRARWDEPKVIYNIASNQSKAQLIVIGNGYQRADDVLGVIQEKWHQTNDPFSSSAYGALRSVPSVGHVMGAWIRSIGLQGVHWVPATANTPIYGIQGLVGTEFTDAGDRTDLAEAGVNTTNFIVGVGYVMSGFFTPSTTKEFMFANGILMREYIKISVVTSLTNTRNEPNNFMRIKNSSTAIWNFLYSLWDRGSTGNVPTGETFGQSVNTDGTLTKPTDHFFVQADLINNPQTQIDLGNRNLDSWFTYPAPSSSIKIGVGLWLRS